MIFKFKDLTVTTSITLRHQVHKSYLPVGLPPPMTLQNRNADADIITELQK